MRKNQTILSRFLLVFDVFIIALAFIAGAIMRDPILSFLEINLPEKNVLREIWWMLLVSIMLMPFLLYQFRFYNIDSKRSFAQSLWQTVRSSFFLGGFLGLIVVFLQLDPSSRLAMVISFFLMLLGLTLRDRLTIKYIRKLGSDSRYLENVIFAGEGEELDKLLEEKEEIASEFWSISGKFDFATNSVEDLKEVIDEHSVQRVVFASSGVDMRVLSRAIEICETQGVEAWVNVSFIRTQLARPDFDVLGGKPMLVLRSTPELSWAILGKQLIDTIGSFLLILVFLIPCLLIYLGIRITSPGHSAIFTQERSGKFGRPFTMFKFRTMIPDAEEKLAAIKSEVGNQMQGPVFKLDNDPRVFKFGSFLRKTSLDELPQLFNVLLGDMSLVGPRPLPVYEVKEISVAKHRRRLSVKPGITCTWQIGGRNNISSFEEWADMDLAYIDSWSLWTDIYILLKTPLVVLFRRGAK